MVDVDGGSGLILARGVGKVILKAVEAKVRRGEDPKQLRVSEVIEAARSLGMSQGTARAALSKFGVRRGRGVYEVDVKVLKASWAGEALSKLAGVEHNLDDERSSFLRATVIGWREGEREIVVRRTRKEFERMWSVLKLEKLPEFLVIVVNEVVSGIYRDREGLMRLAKILSSKSNVLVMG